MKSNFSQLLLDVQKKTNITVRSVRDIRYLKEEIESNTGRIIGFNTLRRLFGFLESRTPNVSTLNTLSGYLGFLSFANYQHNHSTYEQWYFQQNMQRLILENRVGEKEIGLINIGLINTQNIVYFAHFVCYFMERNNQKVLKKIFTEVKFQSLSGTEIQKFALIVSIKLNSLSEKKALNLYEALIPIDNFRNHVPFLYIDYSNLTKRYGKILELIKKNGANESDVLFTQLMKGYGQFYSEEVVELPVIYKPEGFDYFYSVLQGRYFGYQIMRSTGLEKKIKNQIKKRCNSIKVSCFLEEIVPALIVKEEFDFLNHLFSIYYEEIFELEVWSSKTTQAIYLIGLAAINQYKGNDSIAKKNLELVELDRVELGYEKYVSLFYLLISIKLNCSNAKSENKNEDYESLKKLSEETGFKMFLTVANNFQQN
ncbi:hypothetical protein N9544_06445 [Flavobacteriales bacterium]|nr:hypothetical protein [Flavobacteriales bacterium]